MNGRGYYMQPIHVAYAFDDHYANMAFISMTSIMLNTSEEVCFHILESGLSQGSKKLSKRLIERFSHCDVRFHTVDGRLFDNITHTSALSVQTFFRLLLPEVLSDYERIIYVDCDIIFERSIDLIWHFPIEGYAAAASFFEDVYYNKNHTRDSHIRALGMSAYSLYFNAGLMLMDLQLLRKLELTRRALEVGPVLHRKTVEAKAHWNDDQDILNVLLEKQVKQFPYCYQRIVSDRLYSPYIPNIKGLAEMEGEPVCLHFIATKPDPLTHVRVPDEWERYYHYKELSFLRDPLDQARIQRYRELIRNVEHSAVDLKHYTSINVKKLSAMAAHDVKIRKGNKKIALWGCGTYAASITIVLGTVGLYPDMVVDSDVLKQGTRFFEYIIDSPEELKGKQNEYFIVIANLNKGASMDNALAVYGYDTNDFVHVLKDIYTKKLPLLIG